MNSIIGALYRVSSNFKTIQNKVQQPGKISVTALSLQKAGKTKVMAYP